MPGFITHQLIAEKVYDDLQEQTKNRIKDKQLFFFGAQGGDPFYLYKYLTNRKKVNFGKALHRGKIYNIFSDFKNYLERSNDFVTLSYVLGYITHYATDITFHPFVYFLIEKYKDYTNNIRKKDKLHYLIEGDLDVYLLKKYKDEEVKNYKYPLSYRDIQTQKLFDLFEIIYLKECGEELNRTSFSRSIKRFFFYNKMLDDKSYKKQKVAFIVEDMFRMSHTLSYMFKREIPDDKYFNLENDIWHNLDNPEGTKTHSAKELYKESAKLSVELIDKFLEALDSKADLKSNDFSTDFNVGLL